VGLGLVQSHSDGNESHFVNLLVGLERSQWDSEEVECAADAQPNDHMIDGLSDLSAVSLCRGARAWGHGDAGRNVWRVARQGLAL
jgi:hypothetical protein